jgi:peptidoglycan/xylan/chitin deacetylase (PgdA/CDA1 family)
LLYHHIASDGGENRYYVNPENFRQQMHALRDWGYTSITPSYLAQVLIHGGELPERPVIITFDDGNEDVYINAFPILQELGFVGTFYIVADKIGSYNLVDAEQLRELVSAGWEIGSHSSTHLDLTSDYSQMEYEVLGSRLTLEEAIGVPVLSFAYPFGEADDYIYQMTAEYGYTHGMGLGAFTEHTLETLFHLSRCEVQYEFDMDAFAALLPWTGPPPTP